MALELTVPKALRGLLRLGTCSWRYDSWKGLVYDKGKTYRPNDYLPDYARTFESVEVDQWFWSLFPGGPRLPEPSVARLYAKSVPDDFVFTVKAPNSLTLTHHYAKQTPANAALANTPNPHFLDRDLLCRFLEALSPLESKLGPVMFQFEYLNKQKMPTKEVFFEKLGAFIDKAPKGYQYAVEVRNPNYYSPAFFEFLKGRGLGFVYLDGYYMPPIGEVLDKFAPETASFQVVRLHGGDRLEIEGQTGEVWDKIVAPKPGGLRAAAKIVRANAKKRVLTYLNLNNHYEGSAPLSARRFLDVLAGKKTGDEPPF
ncbi:MAG: DUF72 domain-containing protein [Candidatus Aminicenantes bacterium]|nr:DUF72 domain-containing protein [Candidatus Aminicenantes bacterium]